MRLPWASPLRFCRWPSCRALTIIGVTTFVLSFVGVAVGHFFGARFEKPATIAGGVVLILIGVKTLLEHLGVIALLNGEAAAPWGGRFRFAAYIGARKTLSFVRIGVRAPFAAFIVNGERGAGCFPLRLHPVRAALPGRYSTG